MAVRDSRFEELDRAIASGRGDLPGAPPRGPIRPPVVGRRTAAKQKRLLMNEYAMRARQARRTDPQLPKFRRIIQEVCTTHELSQTLLLDGRRTANVVAARVELTHRLRAQGMSFLQIARMTGFHHTTLINHMRHGFTPTPIPIPDWSGEWAI